MKRIQNILLLLTVFLSAQMLLASDPYEKLIKNSAEQLNYLHDRNALSEANGTDDKWYIYFLGGTVEDLRHIEDGTGTIRDSYLRGLNEELVHINESEDTAVYVAFTLHEEEIITPIFPKDATTLGLQQRYVNESLEDGQDRAVEKFSIYTEKYKDLARKIYERTWLFKMNTTNVLMPFSMLTSREILDATGGATKKTYNTYTLYAPQITPDFDKAAFKKLFNGNYAALGTTAIEKKMERLVYAIDDYFINGKRPEVKPCENLLASEDYGNLVDRLGKDDTWIQVIDENPCILDEMYSAGTDWGLETQFEKDLAIFVCTPLYMAMAIPAGAIIGEVAFVELTKELIKRYGVKKVKDVAQTIAINVITQTARNYYFGSDQVVLESDVSYRWTLALMEIDKSDLAQDALVTAFELNTRSDFVLGCLNEGFEVDIANLEDTRFNVGSCLKSVALQIGSKLLIDTSAGFGKKLYNLLKNDPARFERGLKEIIKDSGEEGRKALRDSWGEIQEAFGLKGTLMGKRIEAAIFGSSKKENDLISTSWFEDLPIALKTDIESKSAIKDLFETASDATRIELKEAWEVLSNNPILRQKPENLKNIGKWLNSGLDKQKFTNSIAKSRSKQNLINEISSAKSKIHVQVLIKDFDNIPGITKGRFLSNGMTSGKSEVSWGDKDLDLPMREAQNFVNASAFELPEGTKIYRVTGGNPAGGYWTSKKPESLEEVIGGTAVRPEWNNFENTYVYEVPKGKTLKVWRGTTAKQKVADDISNYHLSGGAEQMFIPLKTRDKLFSSSINKIASPW